MPNSITQAQPPLTYIPPNLNPLVLGFCQQALPLWLKLQTNIKEIDGKNVERLAEIYHQFQEGKIRFLLAFRHPNTHDPYCLGHLIWHLMPKIAQQKGIPLQYPSHFHFIYDRGIPLWAGNKVGWLYSRLGGTPIMRGKIDRIGLRAARELFTDGKFPLAAAPEGATNGHNEIVSPLEPGIAQLAFWCAEDIFKAGRNEQVLLVPLGIQYHYLDEPWSALDDLLTHLENDCGLPALKGASSHTQNPDSTINHDSYFYRRLIRLGGHLLALMEEFYITYYHQKLPTNEHKQDFTSRLQSLLDIALKVAEEYFNLQPKGSVIDRCRRLEQAGWDRIYREDIKDIEAISPLEKGLADRIAEEASLRMWHMRLVESFVAVTGRYVQEKQTVERFAETTLLLSDVITRIKGGNPFGRPKLGDQRVEITVGEPLSVTDRWGEYSSSRRSAVAGLTKDLQSALENMII